MNIRILQILLLLVVITVKAQNTQVIYIDANKKYKKYTPRNTNKTELRAVKNLNKIVSVKKNVTFELIYNDKKSVFKREEMLIPKGEEMHYALAFVSIPSGSYFFKDNNGSQHRFMAGMVYLKDVSKMSSNEAIQQWSK